MPILKTAAVAASVHPRRPRASGLCRFSEVTTEARGETRGCGGGRRVILGAVCGLWRSHRQPWQQVPLRLLRGRGGALLGWTLLPWEATRNRSVATHLPRGHHTEPRQIPRLDEGLHMRVSHR
ncbi:unnamed protein product [Lampetra planeri]